MNLTVKQAEQLVKACQWDVEQKIGKLSTDCNVLLVEIYFKL